MILLIHILILVLILRLSFEKKLMARLIVRRWAVLITAQHVLFWLGYVSVNLYFAAAFFPYPYAIWYVLFGGLINVLLYYICYARLVPAFYETNKYAEYILYVVVLFVLSCLLRILIEPVLAARLKGKPISQNFFLIVVYITQLLVILTASLLAISRYKFKLESNMADLRLLKKETDLNLLKSKINPHFLLNTLNNIYARGYTENNAIAASILQLSQLLQYTIYETGKKRIPVERELYMISSLTALYQLKYGNRLDIHLSQPPADVTEAMEVPPTILFTLFENALKHSAMGIVPDAFIYVGFGVAADGLSFHIVNSIAKENEISHHADYSGIGMKALKGLLQNEYRKSYLLETSEKENCYYILLKLKI